MDPGSSIDFRHTKLLLTFLVLAVVSRPIPQLFQLLLLIICAHRSYHYCAVAHVPEGILFQHITDPDGGASLSKSPTNVMRSFCQTGSHIRVQSRDADIRTCPVTYPKHGSRFLFMDFCGILALRHRHGQS
jgi:hypothetical protein